MPELPEVAQFKRYLDATSLHQQIERTSVTDDRILEDISPQQLGRRLKGRRLERSVRHGKLLLAELNDAGGWLVMHFGMTGDLRYSKTDAEPPPYTKVLLAFANGGRLAYISRRLLGFVGFASDPDEFLAGKKVGPDALADDLTLDVFRDRLAGRKGKLKPLLMNQSVVAGVGNIYADEMLYQARLHPETRADRLGDEAVERLYRAMRQSLATAVEADADWGRLPDEFFLPHRDGDRRCPNCRRELDRTKVAGRTTLFCSRCQKRPR